MNDSCHCGQQGKHLHLKDHRGPKWFHPTNLLFEDERGHKVEWQSRRARKGRYQPSPVPVAGPDGFLHPVMMRLHSIDSELKPHLIGDVSFWVAFMFFVGSVIWVGNGLMSWLPFVRTVAQPERVQTGAASIGLLGAILFEAGAYLMVVEALDRGREANMGTSMFLIFRRLKAEAETEATGDQTHADREKQRDGAYQDTNAWPAKGGFLWWGQPLWHDLGYVAAIIMFFSASVFAIATITGVPGVIPGMGEGEHLAIADVFYSTPQVIGGIGFVVSSLILTLEVQLHWWLPRPFDIGWQIGFWNVAGSVGFLLCGALSYSRDHPVEYETSLATFWGSCAFLIGSTFQLWEALWREPPKS